MEQSGPDCPDKPPANAQPGFALMSVLLLTVLITALVPVMIALNRENVAGAVTDQLSARVGEEARQMFMMAHATMLMHGGLPVGWQAADSAASINRDDLVNCSGFLDRDDEAWNSPDARLSVMTISRTSSPLDGSKLIAGVYRTGYDSVPYEHYVVLGCVISGGRFSQGSAIRAEFALTGQRFVVLGLEAGNA